jgi:transposase
LSASPEVKKVLEQLARSRQKPAWLVRRSQMLLYMLNGATNSATARQFQCHIDTPRKWRKRWLNLTPSLQQLQTENEGELESAISQLLESSLKDEARPGTPATFTPEQVAALYALACEDPKLSGYSFEQWSTPDLAREMVKRGLVETISPGSVWRFLKRGGYQTPPQPLLAQPPGKRASRV